MEQLGSVNFLFGSAGGLSGSGSQLLSEGFNGLPGNPENNDQLGWSLATGDFNNDGFADLAVGVPFETSAPSTAPAPSTPSTVPPAD